MGAPLIPMILGGVFSAASSIYQGRQQAKAYEAQAQVAENNRRTSELLAREALNEGAREEQKFRRQARQFAASQEAGLAGSGAQMSGSALNVMADTASGIEQDATQIRYNTLKNRWGYEVQAVNYLNEANAARASAKNAKRAGLFGAAGSILGMSANIWGASPNGPMNAAAKGGVIKINAPNNPGNFGIGGRMNYVPPDSISGLSYDWWRKGIK